MTRDQDQYQPQQNGYLALILMLWRAKWVMISVFVICVSLGLIFILQMSQTYTASGSVVVRYDDAYVFNPRVGGAGEGESFSLEQIVQTEIGFLRGDAIKSRALNRIGLDIIYPELGSEYARAGTAEQREIFGRAVRNIRGNLGAGAAPNTSLIDVSFTHEDPEIAALFLNALMDEYFQYRREVLLGLPSDADDEQRAEFETRLEEASAALEGFLTEIGVGDFPSELTSLNNRASAIASDLTQAEADLAQSRARLYSINSDLTRLPQEIEQYVENDATGRLLQLEMERQELLTRYHADSEPVREIEQTINGVRQFLASGGGEGAGTRRVGPNPVRQTLESEQLSVDALVSSLAQRVSALKRQQSEVREEQLRLRGLTPQYQRLARNVSALETTLDQIVNREEEGRAQRQLTTGAADNVRIVERAEPPTEGRSMKKLAFVALVLVSGFISLVAGLIYGFFNPPPGQRRAAAAISGGGYGQPQAAQAQPAGFAMPQRDLPVLATISPRHA